VFDSKTDQQNLGRGMQQGQYKKYIRMFDSQKKKLNIFKSATKPSPHTLLH